MDVHEAIDLYQRQLEITVDAPARDPRSAALDLLQEFLGDHAELQALEGLTVADLEEFFVDWYLRQPGVDAAVSVTLLETVWDWLAWSDATHGTQLAPLFEPLYERLRADLPRVLEAWQILVARLRRARREEEEEAGLAGLTRPPATTIVSTGLNRILRPEEIDYPSAREDYFRIERIEGGALTLQSPVGGPLGEEAITPVRVPDRVAALLRPGDILYLEVAPGRRGWEILEIAQAFPGGYASARAT